MPQIRAAVRSWTLPGRAREIHRISRAADDLQVHSGFAVPEADASPRPAGMPGLIQDRVERGSLCLADPGRGEKWRSVRGDGRGLRRWSTAAPPTVLPLGEPCLPCSRAASHRLAGPPHVPHPAMTFERQRGLPA